MNQEQKREMNDWYDLQKQTGLDFLENLRKSGTVDLKQCHVRVKSFMEVLQNMNISFLLQKICESRAEEEYLCTHSIYVALLNGFMGRWLSLPEDEVEKLVFVGLFHDIGKVKITNQIWYKPDKLTAEEYEVVKKHVLYSEKLFRDAGLSDEAVLQGIRGHHEKMDGSGYPDGRRSNDIPLMAKITAVSDMFDAMVVDRSYREHMTPLQVLYEFYRNKFSELDLKFIDLFLDKMVSALISAPVRLSDGKKGKIIFIEKSNFCYPFVECTDTGAMIETNKELYVTQLLME